MTIEVFAPGLEYYVSRLRDNQCYTFTRLGDGEWSSILQDRKRTSSRSQRLDIRALRKQMRKVIIQCPDADNFILSTRPGSERPGIGVWLQRNKPAHLHFHDCRVFYQASKHGRLYPFIRALRDSELPVIVVGPERLRALHGRVFDISGFVSRTAGLGAEDLQSVPLRPLGPGADLIWFVLIAVIGVQAREQKLHFSPGVGGVAGAHERLGGVRFALAGDQRLAASGVSRTGSAETVHR